MEKIQDLTLLSDIFPTGFHGAVTAGVSPGSIVYVAGAGPVGLACAHGCQLLGAACVIVGDMIPSGSTKRGVSDARPWICVPMPRLRSRSNRSSARRTAAVNWLSIAASIALASKLAATARKRLSSVPRPF